MKTVKRTDSLSDFRSNYYQAGDGLVGLSMAALLEGDKELLALINEAKASLDAVRVHLESNYNWD